MAALIGDQHGEQVSQITSSKEAHDPSKASCLLAVCPTGHALSTGLPARSIVQPKPSRLGLDWLPTCFASRLAMGNGGLRKLLHGVSGCEQRDRTATRADRWSSHACKHTVSTKTRRAASHAAMLGNQVCPLTDLAALHERERDKGPVLRPILCFHKQTRGAI